MKRTTEVIPDNAAGHITHAGGNVFADLGFDKAEAKALQAQTREVIAKKLAIKTQLMDSLAQWMAQEKLTQAKAASLLGVSRPRVSDAVRHQSTKFTVDALIDMVLRTGQPLLISL